jgi:homoserine kinase
LQELKAKDGILGAALSGAGPSVLVFLDPRMSASRARKQIATHLANRGLSAELLETSITSRGGRS